MVKKVTREEVIKMLRDDIKAGEDTEATLQTAMHHGIANTEEDLAELVQEARRG